MSREEGYKSLSSRSNMAIEVIGTGATYTRGWEEKAISRSRRETRKRESNGGITMISIQCIHI